MVANDVTIIRTLCLHGLPLDRVSAERRLAWDTAIAVSFNRAAPPPGATLAIEHHGALGHWDRTETPADITALRASDHRPVRALSETERWTMAQIAQWAGDPDWRAAIRQALRAAIEASNPTIILAHGLAGLVAYDLTRQPDAHALFRERTLATFGAPLALNYVKGQFAGRLQPLATGHWINLYNPLDASAPALTVIAPNFEEIETLNIPGDGSWDDAPAFLSHQSLTLSLWADALASPGQTQAAKQQRSTARAAGAHAKRALVIGIDAYPDPSLALEGCVNDAFLMSEVLQENGYRAEDIRLLLNGRATTAGIWERITWLLSGVEDGQERVLYFAGHGAQLPDYGADEVADRSDECLAPSDFDWSRERAITDDRLHALYSQLPYNAKFVIILDCCHSGGMTRAGGRPHGVSPPDDIRHRAMRWNAKARKWEPRNLPPPNPGLTANKTARSIGYV
ncbi:MAG: caspase family protein, partial [Alphaproteobacteria bacterium]